MADEQETGRRDGQDGRWYDPSKMVILLFGIVGFFLIGWGGFVFTLAYGAVQTNLQQQEQIKSVTDRVVGFELRFDRQDVKLDKQDEKLDRIFEKVK